MPRLGVTRTRTQLADIIAVAAARGIEVVPLPVICTPALPFDWPVGLAPETVDWIIFSSAVAVSSFFNRLKDLGITFPESASIAAVGDKTAQVLESFHREVDFVPTESYGQLLFEEMASTILKPGQTALYARASEVNYDPEDLFKQRGIIYFSVTCYETVQQEIPKDVVKEFSDSDYILFTAPSTVRSFHQQFGAPRAKAIAIGNSTSSEMWKLGWSVFSWLPKPDIKLVLEYL